MLLAADQDDPEEEKLRLRGLVGCYALFQYLTVSIQAANTVYSEARERMEELYRSLTPERQLNRDEATSLPSRTVHRHHVSRLASDCQAIAVQQAALLRYNNNVGVCPLPTLRQMLTSALSAWPSSAPLWSGLYMDAVQLFPEHLQEFVDLMTEKELRLRLPLEELDILLED
ncbi:hypothetical protein XENOCAPTIV_029150 [Xenoophorus captivus]|uniref:Uncharacterized protein n=1 Tax=Xenoophorus captivus TaxID=1517983 RepID=A0ABV0Q6N5_9TELE